MMNAIHLLWIVPLSATLGYAACAILSTAKEVGDNE